MDRGERVVFWQRTDAAGAELFRLAQGPDGARFSGTILAVPEGAPLHVEYVIECGPSFETRAVSVALEGEAGRRTLALQVEKAGAWRRDGHVVPALAGCIDVDLGLSPSTNTLPIRRLGLLELAPGTAREVTAAWIGPGLELEALPQRYTRLDGRRFRYEGLASGFTAEIEVDEDGLVVEYPPAWRRVALAR
jgi:uncharacterized protein